MKNHSLIVLVAVCLCFLFLNLNCKKDKSECLTCPPPPPDTTSHVIQWQLPDTLGTQGTIRDVWVFDRNNAWAVGEIYLNDSTGKPDMSNPYNVAHWDGSKWELKIITVTFRGNPVTTSIEGIFAFSPTDIWLASGGDPMHGDGQNWIDYDIRTITGNNSLDISKGWENNSSSMFFVGRGSSIAHFNGSSWTKMTSNTTVDFQDIWGIDGNHIWATGTNTGDGHCVVLQYNGSNWTTLYDSNNQPNATKYQFSTLWSSNSSSLFLDGGSGLHILTLSNLNIGSQINTGLTYVGSCIRGVNQNDIYDVTTGGEVSHYNGSSWHLYPEVQSIGGNNAWWRSVHPTNDFVIISGEQFTGLNSFPVVVRGYR
jgi:hypothetical protein